MKTNIATTQDQSARLLRCGVSADTADMCYQFIDECVNNTDKPICSTPKEQFDTIRGYGFGNSRIHITPAWSLSALLGLIPHVIEVYDDGDYYFSLAQEFPASEDYHSAYKYCWADDDVFVGKRSSCPIEACVQLIEWLMENNYKLNEQ